MQEVSSVKMNVHVVVFAWHAPLVGDERLCLVSKW